LLHALIIFFSPLVDEGAGTTQVGLSSIVGTPNPASWEYSSSFLLAKR
jgi:hypothetical protein